MGKKKYINNINNIAFYGILHNNIYILGGDYPT